jgi:hypothetical protein
MKNKPISQFPYDEREFQRERRRRERQKEKEKREWQRRRGLVEDENCQASKYFYKINLHHRGFLNEQIGIFLQNRGATIFRKKYFFEFERGDI